MKLHLIAASNDSGDNMDLLVWATGKDQALELWDAYYEQNGLGTGNDDPRVFVIEKADRPDGQTAAALAWGSEVIELP